MNMTPLVSNSTAILDVFGLARRAWRVSYLGLQRSNAGSIVESFIKKGVLIQLFVVIASLPLFAGGALSLDLGDGDPHLRIIYSDTNKYVVYRDEFWSLTNHYFGQYPTHQIQVLVDRNFGLKELVQKGAQVEDVRALYPFDKQTAFACEGSPEWGPQYKTSNYWPPKPQIFFLKGDSIETSDDVFVLARSRYGLRTNQLFLGEVGTNIFYWEARDARKVYYRGAREECAKNYLMLPKATLYICGVMRSVSSNKDVGFRAITKSSGFFHFTAPYEDAFIEASFKDAKPVKNN